MQEEGSEQPVVARSPSQGAQLALLGAGIVAADLLVKLVAQQLPSQGWWVFPGVGLQLVQNSGVAFGLGNSYPSWVIFSLAAATLLVLLGWLRHVALRPEINKLIKFASILIISGALANILDRLDDGMVTDFVVLGPWPTFNLADVAISTGVILALTDTFRQR